MSTSQTPIACSLIRGGTSRGVYFLADDLPQEPALRDSVLLAVLGGPDALQVDGVGGGHPLTNKAAIVGASDRDDADVDYLFVQAIPREARVSSAQNCGNILAGVGPFAIDTGLVAAADGETRVRVHMVNSGSLCELTVPTPHGIVATAGDTAIDGVPGTGAPIVCDFLDIAGSACGALLPTGSVTDVVDGVDVTCIDNGMPVILLRAADVGLTGRESPETLEDDAALRQRLEALRLELGPRMQLGDVREKTVPKLCLVSASCDGGHIATRTFIPHSVHRSIGVLGAVSVASAALLPGSVAAAVATPSDGRVRTLRVEHPSGSLVVRLTVRDGAPAASMIERAGVIRTARLLFRGEVQVPRHVWSPVTRARKAAQHA